MRRENGWSCLLACYPSCFLEARGVTESACMSVTVCLIQTAGVGQEHQCAVWDSCSICLRNLAPEA